MSSQPQPQPQMQPKKKGLGPVAWIAIGCGGLIVLSVIVLVAGGLFVAHKVKEAGFDPALWEKNPTLAASKMVATLNPDLEVIKTDEDKGIITVKNKKTGKIMTLDLQDVKNGHIVFKSGDKEVDIQGKNTGQGGSLTVKGDDGKTTTFQSGPESVKNIPDWVIMYPGTTPTNGFAFNQDTKGTGNFTAATSDSLEDVTAYFKNQLEGEGYTVKVKTFSFNERNGAMITGENNSENRKIMVNLNREGDQTKIAVSYSYNLK